MQFLKCLVVVLVMSAGVWAASVESYMDAQVLHPAEETQDAPKINWQPVWDDITRPDIFDTRHHVEGHLGSSEEEDNHSEQHPTNRPDDLHVATSLNVHNHHSREAESCSTDESKGFRNLLLQSKALLPLDKIKALWTAAASSDGQVKEFLLLVKSPEYRAKISKVREAEEYIAVRDFSCEELQLDLKYYAEYIRECLGISEVESNATAKTDRGMKGLLEDINNLIPKDKTRENFENLLKKDETLAEAIQEIKSEKFKQLVCDLREQTDFKDIEKMLLKVGLCLPDLAKLLKNALGWQEANLRIEEILVSL